MKKGQRCKIYLVILIIVMPVCISGCWDRQELNDLAIVSGLGWDIDPGTGEVTFTYQSILPSRIKGSSSMNEGGEQKGGRALDTVQLVKSTGSSPYDVLNRYTQHGSRIPFYQHTQVYVFGREGAEYGIYGFLDTIARNPVSRPNALMVISEKKAGDILGVENGMENIQAFGMAAEIKLSARFSKYPAVTSLEFANRLISKTTAPIAPIVGVFEESGPGGEKTPKLRIAGTAVFKEDRMIGRLNERESSGLLWAINKVEIGFVIIPQASLEIVQAKSKIVPELQDDHITITVEIEEQSNLVEYTGKQDITPAILQEIEKYQAAEIESQVRAAINKSISLNADVFGFGEAIHRKYKKEWQDLKPGWDEIYPHIDVVVQVKTQVNEIGDAGKALIRQK